MINPVKTVVKCCGCIVLSQLIGILVTLAILAAFVLLFYLYVVPWGEDQIRSALHLGSDVDIGSLSASVVAANSCSGCVFGVNTDWPTNTTGALHFLDTSAGPLASGVIATSLAGGAAAGVASMLWASFFPSAASVMSFSSGFYEMTHIIEQAQFISMISQLQIDGAPVFLHAFSRDMAWTNFNVPKSITDLVKSTSRRHRRLSSLLSTTASGETGPKRYAALIGVDPKNLFFYTLLCFAIVLAAIHVLYIIGVVIFSMLSKKESFGQVAAKLYRKVIWACILALLLAQYIFSMAGSFYIYENAGSSDDRDKYYVWGTIGLIVMVGFAILFGVLVISKNKEELEDIGTIAHDQRPFSAKYGAYYDEYNFDNRFFFVPRILLAVSTGAVVGVIQDSTTQLLCILGITVLYLVLLLAREPNLLRFLYYIGITSVFMKIVLVCMMLMLVQDDYFPQEIRDNAAYGIIGVNMFIFFLLFLRQAYTIIHKLVRGCKNKDKARSSSADEVINLEDGNNISNPTTSRNNPPYARMESTPYDNNKGERSFNNNNAMSSQQAGMNSNQQRNPYERVPSETGLAAIGGAGANVRNVQDYRSNAPNEWGQYDARQRQGQGQQQYQNQNAGVAGAFAGGAAASAAVGAAAATRDRGQQNNKYQNGSPVRDRTSFGANQRAADPMERYSTASASPTLYQALNSASQPNNNLRSPVLAPQPARKLSVDVDDMDDDDIVAEPPVIKQTNSAAQSQQASSSSTAGSNPGNPPRVRQSYLRFTDSDMSYDDDIDGRSPHNSTAAVGAATAGAQRGPPTSNSSQFSDFSTDSTATDWFDRRSKTEIETDDASFISAADPNDAVAIAAGVGRPSAFGGERDSMDSYGTMSEIGSTNRSLMTADSTTSAAFTSSNFDSNDRTIDTSGLMFEDDDDDDEEYELTDKQPTSGGIDTTGLVFEDASDGKDDNRDVDIDEQVSFASSTGALNSATSNDSYATQQGTVDMDRSQLTVDSNSVAPSSSASAAANPSYSPPTVYLRDTVVNGTQSENDYDDEYGGERDSYNPHESDSFISALSARSDEDARSFYIEGQRRNTAGGSPGEAAPTEDERQQQQRPMKKL
ncbi:hypothetical protein Gpo141_00006496 [Globisporangium polare]